MSHEGPRRKRLILEDEYLHPPEGWELRNAARDAEFSKVANDDSAPEAALVGDAHAKEEFLEDEFPDGILDHPLERRQVLGGAMAAGMSAGAIAIGMKQAQTETLGTYEETAPHHKNILLEAFGPKAALAEQVHRLRERAIDISAFSHDNIGILGAKYLGVHQKPKLDKHHKPLHNADGTPVYEPLPNVLEHVRFDVNVAKLWHEKNTAYPSKANERLASKLVDEYGEILQHGEETRMTLTQAIADANTHVHEARTNLDTDKVSALYQFDTDPKKNAECLATFQTLADQIDGRLLMSYSMTEIMSVGDAATSAGLYHLLLQTGGMDLITRLPALSDRQPSFGKFQHTPYAMNIYDEKIQNKDGTRQTVKKYVGASQMNRALSPDQQIPEEMQRHEHYDQFVEDKDQNTFAFLFALHNIAETIDTLYRVDPKLVEEFSQISKNTLMEFISTSHHKPHPSTDAVVALLRHLKKGRADSYISECTPELQIYGNRTTNNHAALVYYA